MAVAHRGSGGASLGSVASFARTPLTDIASIQGEDYVIALITVDGDKTATINTPAGWEKFGSTYNSGWGTSVHTYGHRYQASEAATTWSWTGASPAHVSFVAFSGSTLTSYAAAAAALSNTASTLVNWTSVSAPTQSAATVALLWESTNDINSRKPSGYTDSRVNGAAGHSHHISYKLSPTSPTEDPSDTATSTTRWVSQLVTIYEFPSPSTHIIGARRRGRRRG